MEEYLQDYKKELIENGCTEIEVYDILSHDLQIIINDIRERRKKLIRKKIDNLNQITITDLDKGA